MRAPLSILLAIALGGCSIELETPRRDEAAGPEADEVMAPASPERNSGGDSGVVTPESAPPSGDDPDEPGGLIEDDAPPVVDDPSDPADSPDAPAEEDDTEPGRCVAQPELCNGLDDDCDGLVDEDFAIDVECRVGVGACMAGGTAVCSADGASVVCPVEAGEPSDEACDGLDNDCDGAVDEEYVLGVDCAVGVGACARAGSVVCSDGGLETVCSAQPAAPGQEVCDHVDNDCDGEPDEGVDACVIQGQCVAEGTRTVDGCGICDPSLFRQAWTPLCGASLDLDSRDDFARGALAAAAAGADLHIRPDGVVAPIRALDVTSDGWPDLPSWVFQGPDHATASPIYVGGPDGFAEDRTLSLNTTGCVAMEVADVDSDGWQDVLVANHYDGRSWQQSVGVHRGGPAGPSADMQWRLPASGPLDVAVGDVNRDGFLDAVVANYRDDQRFGKDLLTYFGTADGFDLATPERLPVRGPHDIELADMDRDGWLDLVLAQYSDGGQVPESWVVYGGPDGFAPFRVLRFPTSAASGVSVADLDADGWLDLVFAEYGYDGEMRRSSRIYWGSGGRSLGRGTMIATSAARAVSIADLDDDGVLDVLFSNATNGNPLAPYYLYWGPISMDSARSELTTYAAMGKLVADFDGDGDRDVAFYAQEGDYNVRLYEHGPGGLANRAPTDLGEGLSYAAVTKDPGAIYDRRQAYVYETPAWDAGVNASRGRLTWEATLPEHTSIRAWVRSGGDDDQLAAAEWLGPDGTGASWYDTPDLLLAGAHTGDRHFQVRFELRRFRAVAGPFLERIRLDVAPPD